MRSTSSGDGRPALVEIGAQVVALARAHRVEFAERRVHRLERPRRELGRDRPVGSVVPLADRQRLRQPQQVARRQRPGDQPALARLVERRLQRRDRTPR